MTSNYLWRSFVLYSLLVCFKDLFTASLLFSCHWSNVRCIYENVSRWRQGADFVSYHLVWLASVHLVSPWGCCKESESCHICHGKADIILSKLVFMFCTLLLSFYLNMFYILISDAWKPNRCLQKFVNKILRLKYLNCWSNLDIALLNYAHGHPSLEKQTQLWKTQPNIDSLHLYCALWA